MLTAWHGVDLAELESEHCLAARPLATILQEVARRHRFHQKLEGVAVQAAWDRCVDPTVVAHARPVALRRGTLVVAVDSSVWLDEIVRYRSKEILTRLQHALGKEMVQKIQYRLG